MNPFYFLYFHNFHYMGYFGKTLAFWVGADSLEVLQSEPVNYSGFQPSAVMPSLKPAPQEQLRAGKHQKRLKTYQGLTLTVGSNPTKFQTFVINIKKVTVHYTLIMLGTLILKIWLQDFLHRYCGVLATF